MNRELPAGFQRAGLSDSRSADVEFQEETMGMRFLGEQALIDVEIFFSRSTSFDPTSGTAGNRNLLYWNNGPGTPIDDVITICSLIGGRTGRRPNVMVMGRQVWDALHRNARRNESCWLECI